MINFFIVIYCLSNGYGQTNFGISRFTKDYGKNYRWVYDITQDNRGFMCFASHTGLRR